MKQEKKHLRNIYSQEDCLKRLEQETFQRKTLSFYRYVQLTDLPALRATLYNEWSDLSVLGRVYIAEEGINAQINVPEHLFDAFVKNLESRDAFRSMPLKIAVEEKNFSFYKLTLKIKKQIVADGLKPEDYDVTNVGKHLNAEEFNAALELPETVVVDMRNQYESEVGRFKKALCPDADTFRDELVMLPELLKDKKDKKILLYCTGGVRCEKTSAYLKHHGFEDVNQLYGGVIQYAHEIKEKNLPSQFLGKNFVFDERMGERITDDILSTCHQCSNLSDNHTNCLNEACHLLFIQCDSCKQKFEGCCSQECNAITKLPLEEQKIIRQKASQEADRLSLYRSRLRPKLKEKMSSCT